MFVLDTDTLSLLLRAHVRVTDRVAHATEEVAITLITRTELLQRRFASVLKAENGEKLIQAQHRLDENEGFGPVHNSRLRLNGRRRVRPPAKEQEAHED